MILLHLSCLSNHSCCNFLKSLYSLKLFSKNSHCSFSEHLFVMYIFICVPMPVLNNLSFIKIFSFSSYSIGTKSGIFFTCKQLYFSTDSLKSSTFRFISNSSNLFFIFSSLSSYPFTSLSNFL